MMHRSIRYRLLLLLGAVAVSCASFDEKVTLALDEDIIASARDLQAGPLPLIDGLKKNAKALFVYRDSILIVLNKNVDDAHAIELYDLSDCRTIARLYRFGSGTDGLLSAEAVLNGNRLIVNDSIRSQVVTLNIDSVLRNHRYAPPPLRYGKIGAPKAVPFYDDLLVENPDFFHNKDMRIRQGDSRFIVMKQGESYTANKSYKYYTKHLAVNGQILVDEEKGRVLYGRLYESLLEVYDSDLRLIRSVSGPMNIVPNYRFEGTGGYYRIEFKHPIPYAYLNCCADADYVYLVYAGGYLKKEAAMNSLSHWILKFDWEGNFVQSYRAGMAVLSLSKSVRDADAFYAAVSDENGQVSLVRLAEKE